MIMIIDIVSKKKIDRYCMELVKLRRLKSSWRQG